MLRRLQFDIGSLTADRQGRSFALALLFAITWLISHPYLGLRHDGVLYFGQLLHRLHPERFAADPYFRFGSQDSYSVFSTVAAWVTDAVGIFTAAPLLLVATQTAMAVAVVLLAYRLQGRKYAWYGAIFVAAMPAWYAGWHVFSYAESFLTARSVAEPIVLSAITLLISGRRWWSLLVLVIAATVHPLMALPALAIWWLTCSLQDRRIYWFALLGTVPPLLGLLGVAPFDRFFATYDHDWAALVEEVNPFIIPTGWLAIDWCTIAVDFIVLFAAARTLTNALARQFLRALIVVTAVALLIGSVAFTVLHNVLLTQLQVWRSLWLLHIVAVLFLPVLILQSLQRTDGCGKMIAPSWIITALTVNTYAAPAAALFAYSLMRRGAGDCPQLSTPLARKAIWACVVLIPLAVFWRWSPPPELTEHVLGETGHDYLRFVRTTTMRFPIPLLASLLLLPLALRADGHRWRLGVLLSVALIMMVTLDQRTPWAQFVEHQKADTHPFLKYVGADQNIYWDGHLVVPWLVLGRSSYYLSEQAAGTVFNRDTAMTLAHRKSLLKYVDFQLSICGIQAMVEWKSATQNPSVCVPTYDVLRDLCESDDPPDFMVFEESLSLPALSTWTTTVPKGHGYNTYYLYSCEQMRATAPETSK